MKPSKSQITALYPLLLRWYDASRRDLPWRRTRDPYSIWLSEVMLQQTRVETVIPYYAKFLASFPTVHALAEAPLDDVLSYWSGLGYYRRARMLHDAAKQIDARGGSFPANADELQTIRGIGRYTAGAIASIAFDEQAALVDGNVARVLARLFGVHDDVRSARGMAQIWAIAEQCVPSYRPGDWNQALMELGATTCIPHAPRCLLCPLRAHCFAHKKGLERTLPTLKPKAKPKKVHRIALVVEKGGRVLFARRKRDGLFGGMWEPPSFVSKFDASEVEQQRELAQDLAAALFAQSVKLVEHKGDVTHVLSHRRLSIDVWRATCSRARNVLEPLREEYDDVAFVNVDATASERYGLNLGRRGTTTLAHKILRAAFSA